MFDMIDSDGRPLSAVYTRTRMRWEPVMEITQIKGTSEVHPQLSPDDPFAGFEVRNKLLTGADAKVSAGSYARNALMQGLQLVQSTGANHYKFEMVGSSDSHFGLAAIREDDCYGKLASDSLPASRVEMQGNFAASDVLAEDGTVGYQKGVPMGGDLSAAPAGKSPTFLVQVSKDPQGANLDRVEIINGWLDASGKTHGKVYDVAWAGQRTPNAKGFVPALPSTVNVERTSYENSVGTSQLNVMWRDPAFDPKQRAFYYVRALEIETPRHQVYDAVALKLDPKVSGKPLTIQERAWSSPIWYTP